MFTDGFGESSKKFVELRKKLLQNPQFEIILFLKRLISLIAVFRMQIRCTRPVMQKGIRGRIL